MRKLLWFVCGFTAACALGAYFYSEWFLFLATFAMVLFLILIFWIKKWKPLRFVATLSLGLSVGLFWFIGYREFRLLPLSQVDGEILQITAEVTDFGRLTDYGASTEGSIVLDGKSFRSVLYLKESEILQPGDQITGSFRLRLTHEGLEGDTYHRGNGTLLLAYAQEKTKISKSDQIPLRYYPSVLRKNIIICLEETFPEDTAFFAKALLLGDRSDVNYETNTAFKVSGISHIIAVSGLHVSILFSVLSLVTGRKRYLTALVGIPVLILFAAVTGFTPSVTRACVMQILMILAVVINREYDPLTALAAAVLLMLLVNPLVITSASFQLSVGCIVGIFAFSGRIQRYICGFSFWRNWKGKTMKVRLRNWFASGLAVTLSAMIFTTPLVAYYFGTVSLLGVLTNLLTLWVVSWIFYGIMAVCVMSLVWQQGAGIVAWLVSWLIRYVLLVAKGIAHFPLAAIYTKSPFMIAWLGLCYALLLVFFLWKHRKPYILMCCVVLGLMLSFLCSWLEPLVTDYRVSVLNVGQGQSVLLQSHGRTFLVDCGGDTDTVAADTAAETLLSMGIYRLDGIIVTHYDADHAGGVPELLSRIPADIVLLPEYSEDEQMKQELMNACGSSVSFVREDLKLSWLQTELTIFAPVSEGKDNESGLCVLFHDANCDILITGDLGISGENKLILEKNLPQLTGFVAGHHGSNSSTGLGLLSALKPQYVFISVGEDNPYDHPSPQLMERLGQYNCQVYRTDLDGTIVFRR